MITAQILKHLRFNVTVNLLDGAFFGFAIGFASFVTIIPLFVSTLTGSAILIGLIPAIHSVGWQLPQLFTSHRVARQKRYKPMVLLMTTQERLPFLGLALVALLAPRLPVDLTLALVFFLLVWQGLGGGFTATAWQSMIGKIIPSERRGTFFGAQSASANALASLGAVLAGWLLVRFVGPLDFALCFLLAFLAMAISWIFLSLTREPAHQPPDIPVTATAYWSGLREILRQDRNFRWFLLVRMASQFAIMGTAFYTVYAVNQLGMSEMVVGLLTGALLATQILANPIMGWFGDRYSHRGAMLAGILAGIFSALLAWWAPTPAWFFPVFILAGIANVAIWTVSLAMIQEFGQEIQRPAYIGLANTLIAPATFIAPLIGGWLAGVAGYPATFIVSAVCGLLTLAMLYISVQDPRRIPQLAAED